MSRPILVGYEPQTLDRAPVRFAVAIAHFTGTRLIVACVVHGVEALERLGAGSVDEALADPVGPALDNLLGELGAQGVAIETRELRALEEAAGAAAAR